MLPTKKYTLKPNEKKIICVPLTKYKKLCIYLLLLIKKMCEH